MHNIFFLFEEKARLPLMLLGGCIITNILYSYLASFFKGQGEDLPPFLLREESSAFAYPSCLWMGDLLPFSCLIISILTNQAPLGFSGLIVELNNYVILWLVINNRLETFLVACEPRCYDQMTFCSLPISTSSSVTCCVWPLLYWNNL